MLNKMGIPLAGAQQWQRRAFADYGVKDVERIMCFSTPHLRARHYGSRAPSPREAGRRHCVTCVHSMKKATHKRATKAKEKGRLIRSHAGIRYNTVTRRIEINGTAKNFRNIITDRDENTLWR